MAMSSLNVSLVSVDNVPFYIPAATLSIPAKSRRLVYNRGSIPDLDNDLIPISLIVFRTENSIPDVLMSIIDNYSRLDDVFGPQFSIHVFLFGD